MGFLETLGSRRILEVPHLRMSRRRLFHAAAATGGTAIAASISLHTPDTSSPLTALAAANGYEIYPGWIEGQGNAPFIQFERGHFYWMREKINNNPILLELTRDFFRYTIDHAKRGERLRLGDALQYCIDKAEEKIRAIDTSKIDPDTNIDMETIRTAYYPLAAVFTAQWWTKEDLEAFGVSSNEYKYKNIDDLSWGERGIARIAYPKLFGVDKEEPKESSTAKEKYGGQDRALHFAHHGLIVFELLYSQIYGLSIHESMPHALKILLIPVSIGSPYQSARSFSEVTGWLYEVSGLKDINNWPIRSINERTEEAITEGIFDDMSGADLRANRLGAEAATALFRRAFWRRPIDDIIARLNDPRYADLETPPTLNLPR